MGISALQNMHRMKQFTVISFRYVFRTVIDERLYEELMLISMRYKFDNSLYSLDQYARSINLVEKNVHSATASPAFQTMSSVLMLMTGEKKYANIGKPKIDVSGVILNAYLSFRALKTIDNRRFRFTRTSVTLRMKKDKKLH
ncbi:hypothetical protein A3Q56_07897 [Intoshia linei]|uniref:Uncharacterized protein n=1 Tax=Intoshia linei TaxID=1819745 RepID=A0A177AQX7_9BILA|nr:hypothetical protein A3Q56_07897 [Intoshia linei]